MRIFLVLGVLLMSSSNGFTQEPFNGPAELKLAQSPGGFELRYQGQPIFSAQIEPKDCQVTASVNEASGCVTQTIRIAGAGATSKAAISGVIMTGSQAFAAETASAAQGRMPLVRTSVGPSTSCRNNAVYDREHDWLLELPPDVTRIMSASNGKFSIHIAGAPCEIKFKPRYYQHHKGIRFFEPWKYNTWPKSVCGWCSWWAYKTRITQKDVDELAQVFDEKLRDYGYEYVQIDDGYQKDGWGLPESWLQTNERFPDGLEHIVKTISDHRLEPGLWVNCSFLDPKTVAAHPDWFVKNASGEAHKGPWVDYGLDATNPEALQAITHNVYKDRKKLGWRYIKVDSLRHLLYDAYYPCRAYLASKGSTPEEAFRKYLGTVREELGRETYMLSCWGVLPESVGLADACRLGGDGFGPSTMLQYNSWNNVVWRNDPDHVDISPEGEEIIRPVLVSMAGCQLMLSDKIKVYQDDNKIEGARRSAPILVSMPGQLYDIEPSRSDAVREGRRNTNGGSDAGPTDASQRGLKCEWWLQEINRPFEQWTVLARLEWEDLPETKVVFANLGLPEEATYIVHEFWTGKTLGVFQKEFPAMAQKAKDVRVYAIRPVLDRPQVVSTNRHISQGGVDLDQVNWNESAHQLAGQSQLVRNDSYTLTVRVPAPYRLESAKAGDNLQVTVQPTEHNCARVSWTSPTTQAVDWTIRFAK